MEICEEGHDAIVYDGRSCPLCDLVVVIEEAKSTVEDVVSEYEQRFEEIKAKFKEAEENGLMVSELWLKKKIEELAAESRLDELDWEPRYRR